MFVLGEARGRDKAALLSRLNPMEADGRGPFQIKVVTFHHFKSLENALKFGKERGFVFDMRGDKTSHS